MLYIHYCSHCRRIHILSGHRTACPACDTILAELKVPYTTYITWGPNERASFLTRCHDPACLDKLSTIYTMHKYKPRNRE